MKWETIHTGDNNFYQVLLVMSCESSKDPPHFCLVNFEKTFEKHRLTFKNISVLAYFDDFPENWKEVELD